MVFGSSTRDCFMLIPRWLGVVLRGHLNGGADELAGFRSLRGQSSKVCALLKRPYRLHKRQRMRLKRQKTPIMLMTLVYEVREHHQQNWSSICHPETKLTRACALGASPHASNAFSRIYNVSQDPAKKA